MMRGNFGLLKIINENKIVVNARAAEYDNNKILILTKDTLEQQGSCDPSGPGAQQRPERHTTMMNAVDL